MNKTNKMNKINKSQIIDNILLKYDINEKYSDKINEFLEFLLKKNLELNLMSRKLSVSDIIYDHFEDCLSAHRYFTEYDSIADIGTGGGLPGILLAIIFEDKRVELYDKSPKKSDYLKEAINTLNLKNAALFCGTVSSFEIKTSVATCRAFKPIAEIIDHTKRYFDNRGAYLLYKGRREVVDEEIKTALKSNNFIYNVYKIDSENRERNIVFLQKSNKK